MFGKSGGAGRARVFRKISDLGQSERLVVPSLIRWLRRINWVSSTILDGWRRSKGRYLVGWGGVLSIHDTCTVCLYMYTTWYDYLVRVVRETLDCIFVHEIRLGYLFLQDPSIPLSETSGIVCYRNRTKKQRMHCSPDLSMNRSKYRRASSHSTTHRGINTGSCTTFVLFVTLQTCVCYIVALLEG